MLDKSTVRDYFIQKNKCSLVPQELAEKLEGLSLFSGEKSDSFLVNRNAFLCLYFPNWYF